MPKGSKLNPISGFKRIFGTHALVELGKAILKFSLVAGVLWWSLLANMDALVRIGQMGLEPALDAAGKMIDLAAMLRDLARREINELHVEAGHKLNGSFIREGLVDEYLVYLAPQLLGPGQGMANLPVLTALSDAVQLGFHAVDRIGPDLRLLLRRV